MSHFLAHLVQRTLGESVAVEPRPASRFESAAPPAPFMDMDPVTVAEAPERSWLPPPQDDSPPREAPGAGDSTQPLQALAQRLEMLESVLARHRRSEPPATDALLASPPRVDAGHGASSGKQTEASASGLSSLEIQDVRFKAPKSQERQSQTKEPRDSQGAAPSQADGKTPARREKDRRRKSPAAGQRLRPAQQVESIGIEPALVAVASDDGTTAGEQPGSGERRERRALPASPWRAVGTAPTVLAPQSARQSAAASIPGRNRALAESEPTINVTIGRIEVRAMPAPPPPAVRKAPRQGPAQPAAMSLDEYLRRRNGGAP